MQETPLHRFGRWTTRQPLHGATSKTYVECQCVCGTVRQILYQNLKSGQSRGCAKCHLDKVRPSFPPGATITPDQARKVKDLLGTGLNMAEVSRALGLTYYVVRGIARGTAWKDA